MKKLNEVEIVENSEDISSNTTLEEDYLNKNELFNICKRIHRMDEKTK